MPRIQEYQTQEAAAEPQGAATPNLEAIGQLGQGVERLGGQITETGNVLQDRSAQMEAADANATVSEARTNYFDRVRDETNRGVLDQGKLFDDYDDEMNEAGAKFTTARGRAEFERASARTRGSLVRTAAAGSIKIAGQNQQADFDIATNASTNMVLADHTQFPSEMAHLEENLNGLQESGNFNQEDLRRLGEQKRTQLAQAAVKSLMQQDHDNVVQAMVQSGGKVDLTDPKFNTADQMLNKVVPEGRDSPVFDDYLDSGKKGALDNEIRTNLKNAQIDGVQKINLNKFNTERQQTQWLDQSANKFIDGSITTDDIKKSPLDFQHKMHAYAMIQSFQKKENVIDPSAFNSTYLNILSPDNAPGHINSDSDLAHRASFGGIDPTSWSGARDLMHSVQGNQVDRLNEYNLVKSANSRLTTMDPVEGQYRSMMFIKSLQQAKQQAVQDGKNPNTLFDPKSKDYFGNSISQFQQTPQDVLKQQVNLLRQNITPPAMVDTQAGVNTTPGIQPTSSLSKDITPAPEQTIIMYKDGIGRVIPQSKVAEATKRGYAGPPTAPEQTYEQKVAAYNTANAVEETKKMREATLAKMPQEAISPEEMKKYLDSYHGND